MDQFMDPLQADPHLGVQCPPRQRGGSSCSASPTLFFELQAFFWAVGRLSGIAWRIALNFLLGAAVRFWRSRTWTRVRPPHLGGGGGGQEATGQLGASQHDTPHRPTFDDTFLSSMGLPVSGFFVRQEWLCWLFERMFVLVELGVEFF